MTENNDSAKNPFLEENGHRWERGIDGDRCVFCQIRIEYYRSIKKAAVEQPDRDFSNSLKCRRSLPNPNFFFGQEWEDGS